jgi:hypothetical protein
MTIKNPARLDSYGLNSGMERALVECFVLDKKVQT